MSTTIDTRRLEERAIEPITKLFTKKLMVPNIYIHPRWPKFARLIDLLAIDRAGSGDVHIVEIAYQANSAVNSIPKLMKVPAAYRWIAFFSKTMLPFVKHRLRQPHTLFPAEGPGRIGIIEVNTSNPDDALGDTLEASILVQAERFPGAYYEMAQKFAAKNPPDIEFP